MKYLIAFLLLLSSSFANAIDQSPEGGAACGYAYGYEVCLWALNVDGDEYGLRASYRYNNGEWQYLAQKSHFISNMQTMADTDYYFNIFVTHINDSINNHLKPITVEPEYGLERLKWLVSNKLTFSNNQLIYSQ